MDAPDMDLKTPQARRLWARFKRDLAFRDRDLSAADRQEALAETVAHIHDAFLAAGGESEVSRLTAALHQFGPLEQAPPAWRKPLGIILHQAAILFIGIACFFVLALLHMAVMDLFNPDAVGLYIHGGGDFTLSYEAQPHSREVLGGWFAPAAIGVAAVIGTIVFVIHRLAIASSGPVSGWIREQ